MNASKGQTFIELLGDLLADHVVNAVTTAARWAYIGWWSFSTYLGVVFILAVAGYQHAAIMVWALVPSLVIVAVVLLVPGMALGAFLLPALHETRVGSVVTRLLQRYVKGVFGGGWFAFSFGNDVSDIMRFRWSHPWLSALLCVFAVPAVYRELIGEEEWGFWGVGACILSGIVFTLDMLAAASIGRG